ncbi:MAG: metallophosphoesterase [Paracoccaceae bacterium]
MHSYAIGDIHGHIDLLRRAHDRIALDIARHGPGPVVHVGDLVDRGPDSAGVVEHLRKGMEAGQDWVVLKGNHDRMFTLFLDDPKAQDPGLRADLSWLHPRLGGGATLDSYGVRNASDRPIAPVHAEAVDCVPAAHRRFLESRPTMFRHGEAVFVHAGIRPGIPLDQQAETDLVWIREPFLMDPFDHGALIVHGHTAVAEPILYRNRLNIDSSAAYGGPLTSVVIEGRSVYNLTDAGRVEVRRE